ncbi:MAG: helicase-related protein, partial [Anaerolineales bacterium]
DLAMQTYVEEDESGWPVTKAWEDLVLSQISARLPEMQGKRGLLPPQAVRAVGMARALLDGEKTVFGVMAMGYGKTYISLTVRELLMACKRIGLTIVLCPPHLMKKWKREARWLAPDNLVLFPKGNGKRRLTQVFRVLNLAAKGTSVILILSREMVKLGPLHKPQLVRRFFPHYGHLWACPHCGVPAATDAEPGWGRKELLRYAETYPALSKDADPPRRLQNKACPACQSKYAGPEPTPRRWPLAEIIYRAVKRGQIRDLLLLGDEIHEYRNASLQGTAFSRIFRVARWAVLLTGTLHGGKASDLYRLLRWTSPELRRVGLGEREFVKKYGYMEAVETRDEKRAYRRKVRRSAFRERPGVSPTIYRFLLPRTAFGALRDVAAALPSYTEESITVSAPSLPVDGVFSKTYGGHLYHNKGQGAFMAWLRAALGYYNIAAVKPTGDRYGDDSHIYSYVARYEDGEMIKEEIVLNLPHANTLSPLPKEAELLSIVRAEKAEHRKTVLLLEQTITRPLPTRLIEILNGAKIRATYLDTSRVPASSREAWIDKNAYEMDVLITHPRAVETGLDLVMFQTVVVYEAIYAVISLAQAVARVWRLGQNRPVRVFSLAYEDNLEQDAWRVIAKKIAWSKSVYGDFIPSGLGDAGLDENLDLLSALTEAIASPEGRNGRGMERVSPETTLAGIQRELLSKVSPVPTRVDIPQDVDAPAQVMTLEEWLALRGAGLGSRPRPRRRKVEAPESQLSLF